jgi:RNA polymerase sigma-70 factor, ECF subfamily
VHVVLERLTLEAEGRYAFRVERVEFQRKLLAAVDGASDPAAALGGVHAVDLYLAVGCSTRQPAALNEFSTRYLSQVQRYLRGLPGISIRPDEVRRELEDTLLFGRGGPGRIAQYGGRGPLERFVAIAARNSALTLRRQQARWGAKVTTLKSAVAVELDRAPNLAPHRFEAELHGALREAIAGLDLRQRTIIRMHFIHGLSFTHIARMLRVHQSTVSRTFATTVRELQAAIERKMRAAFHLDDREVLSVMRELRGRMDISLSRVLRETVES